MTFGEKLEQLYKSRGLTQKQLAAKICVSRSAIAKWVSGRGIPCEVNIKELCEFFDVEEAWLFGTEELRKGMEAYEHALERVQKGFDVAFSVWNTVLLFIHILCSVAAILGGFFSQSYWLLPVAATSMWDTGTAVNILYDIWAAWWRFFALRGLEGGKVFRFISSCVAILFGTICGLALNAIATFLVYPPIGDKSGACRIREALYRFGVSLARRKSFPGMRRHSHIKSLYFAYGSFRPSRHKPPHSCPPTISHGDPVVTSVEHLEAECFE